MFGLDQWISGLAHGANPAVVVAIAVLLGLRHATDPDHLVAVSTLVATEPERRVRRASLLGLSWGLGHATSLIVLGVPFVFLAVLVPERVESGAEAVIGLVIMLLAVRLLVRWRRGAFHVHPHRHGVVVHRHLHAHAPVAGHVHEHRVRTPHAAYGLGILHGVGGSAGVALLLLAGIPDQGEALVALVLFALATAASMALLSSGLGVALGREVVGRRFGRAVPALGALGFAFGLVYSVYALASIA